MIRFIMPVILIAISLSVFFVLTNPIYNSIATLRTDAASYNEALSNSKALENERDKLTAKLNSINPENLIRLQKLLPENIDNIRLILEIEQIASPYGMVLKDVKYNATSEDTALGAVPGAAPNIQAGGLVPQATKDYGSWDLAFSTSGSYNNFLNFIRDLEKNLRIVDISSIDFSSETGSVSTATSPQSYTYNFKIKTYWLRN